MPVKKLKVKNTPASPSEAGRAKPKVVTQKTKSIIAKKVKMANGVVVDVHDLKGKVIGKVALPKEVFQAKINKKLMAQAVRVYLANNRQGTLSTKTRGQVQGSTRKLYKQKGTGRARAGSLRSPVRVGGGIIFGPKPRDFSLKLSKKMRRRALLAALSTKCEDKAIHVIDGLDRIEPKVKNMVQVLTQNELPMKDRILLVLPSNLKNVKRAAANIKGVELRLANTLNTYDVLVNKKLILMKDAIGVIEKIWGK